MLQSRPSRRIAAGRILRRCGRIAAFLLVVALAIAVGKATQLATADYLGAWLAFDLASLLGLGLFAAVMLLLGARYPRLRR